MSSHSGTIGRSRGLSVGSQIRRQRSVEWHHEHGYSSSEDDDRIGRGSINPSFDSQLLAQLIAQSQQLSSKYLPTNWTLFNLKENLKRNLIIFLLFFLCVYIFLSWLSQVGIVQTEWIKYFKHI